MADWVVLKTAEACFDSVSFDAHMRIGPEINRSDFDG